MSDFDDPMLGKPQVAALLRCGERALERLIENRRFPPGRRYGRCIFWFKSTVAAFLTAERQAQHAWLPQRSLGTRQADESRAID